MSEETTSPNVQIVQETEQPIPIGIENPLKLRLIRLKERRGSLFPGEVGGWPDPIAQRMIDEGVGFEVDENGQALDMPQVLESPTVLPVPSTNQKSADAGDGYKFDERTDPFMTDGITKTASIALHKRGLHTPVAVRQFIVDGGNVNDIPHINDTQAEKINKLYGQAEDDNGDE